MNGLLRPITLSGGTKLLTRLREGRLSLVRETSRSMSEGISSVVPPRRTSDSYVPDVRLAVPNLVLGLPLVPDFTVGF